jgi:site-specific recombinase XerD
MCVQWTAAVKVLRITRQEAPLRKGWGAVPDRGFCNEAGQPRDGDTRRHRVFDKVLATAGLRRLRCHELRQPLASRLIQHGERLGYVNDPLGYSALPVTGDT